LIKPLIYLTDYDCLFRYFLIEELFADNVQLSFIELIISPSNIYTGCFPRRSFLFSTLT